jgi:hypothetical protein
MSNILRSQLEQLYPDRKVPDFFNFGIEDAYEKFCKELADLEITDKRKQVVKILERNFPKLLGMKLRDPATGDLLRDENGYPIKAKAKIVLKSLKDRTFDSRHYRIESGRLRTLFWLPDVISNSDAIHPNGHEVIDGDEVYVKKYAKQGSDVKLVVTQPEGNKRIIITSFLIEAADLSNYVNDPAIWPKK